MFVDPEVVVLFEGYSRKFQDVLQANCTCTLIKAQVNIIVDTMTAWDGERIKMALKEHDLTCNDIKFVICTHGHSDHIGCNYLFPMAQHLVGYNISQRDSYKEFDFNSGSPYEICQGIKVIGTPGHTMQDVSVIVSTVSRGIIAITGDLFENQRDIRNPQIWKDAGSDNEELQEKHRKEILRFADYIVPGHGPMFKVSECI
nr:metallo-beta-lactamase domain-containing protein 1 [Onthophagus taurus]